MGQSACIRLAGTLGALAVVLGAFGAHGLKDRLATDMLAIYQTGVTYHFYHALALLALGVSDTRLWRGPWARRAAVAWTAGIVIFSGSLYLLALSGQKWLGAITPFGGLAMIVGWGLLAMGSRTVSAAD